MKINNNPNRVDWTKNHPGQVSVKGSKGPTGPSGVGHDASVQFVEGGRGLYSHFGHRVNLTPPCGAFDFGAGKDACGSIESFLGAGGIYTGGVHWLDDEEIDALGRHLGDLKRAYASNNTMLNMIELMELLIDLHQKQRDAINLMRQAEAEKGRADLQQKADLTRAGAMQNFIMGMIGSAVSLAFSALSLKSSIASLKGMTRTMNEDIGLEKMELMTSSNLTNNPKAEIQAKRMEVKLAQTVDENFQLKEHRAETPSGQTKGTPGEGTPGETEKPPVTSKEQKEAAAEEENEFCLLEENKVKKTAPETKPGEVVDIGEMPPGKGADHVMEVDKKFFGKSRELLFSSDGRLKLVDSKGNKIPLKPGVSQKDLAKVKTVRQALEVIDFDSAEISAEFKSGLQGTLSADYQTARGEYTQLLQDIDSREGDIEAGTYKENEKSLASAKEVVSKKRVEAADLKKKLGYLKAVEVLGGSKCMSAKEIAKTQSGLQWSLSNKKHEFINGAKYKTLENKLQMANTWAQVGNSIKEIFSNIGAFLQAQRQSEATEAEVDQTRHQQEMDSLKELADKCNESLKALADLLSVALLAGSKAGATLNG